MYNLDTSTLTSANIVLGTLHAKVSSCVVPDFGSNMLLHNVGIGHEEIVLATVKHRIVNKFEPSPDTNDAILRDACMAEWVLFESKLRESAIYSREHGNSSCYRHTWWSGLTPATKKVLFKAREICHTVFRNLAIDLHDADIEFTPGETNISSGGRVSIEEKLKNILNWCVTSDAADDFIRLCYHNYSLKSAAKAHFSPLTKGQLADLAFHHNNDGYAIFKARMEEIITIVPGSVGDSVYKNRKSRRFINKEPMGNMLLQRLPSRAIREVFNSKILHLGKGSVIANPLYNPLDSGQERHRMMIADDNVSTVDWKNASDSIHRDGTRFLFPAKLNNLLERWRSPMVLISDGKYQDWYVSEKLCSMGNGFCFEILTLVLLALARTLDPHASVYGDDVIINNDHVDEFIAAAQALGFSLNTTKSFVKSDYRESCGAFYYKPVGYITSFDITRCESETDIIVCCNKLSSIIRAHPFLRDLILPTWHALTLLVPASRTGPFPSSDEARTVLNSYVWMNGYLRRHKKEAPLRKLRSKLIERYRCVLVDYQLNQVDDQRDDKFSQLNIVEIPVFIPKSIGKTPNSVKCVFKRAMYMYAGRKTKNLLRPKPTALVKEDRRGEWVSTLYFVLPNGRMISCKLLEQQLQAVIRALVIVLSSPREKDFLSWMAVVPTTNPLS